MKNGDYWKKRMMMLEESSHRSAQETYKEISDALDDAMYQMDSVIEKWLQRIATNNGISMAEARKWLKNAELDEFKWTLEQYIKKGQQNAFDQQWMKELENASARAHITRLEAMEMSLNQYAQEAFGQENKLTGDLLTQIYQDRYGHTAFEIAKSTGVGVTLGGINAEAVKTVLQNPWASDGKIFSNRIWSSMDDMKAELHKQLTRQILTGAAPDAAIKAMTKYVAQGVTSAKYRAGRLVMTEAAAIGNLAQHNCYKELGVEEFEVVATLDGHTCKECGSMDGKHFPMKQFEEGVTAPPFHANCRCCTAPYFEDDSVSTRMARNPETEKSEYIPNMTYNEWKEKYVSTANVRGAIASSGARILDPDSADAQKWAASYYAEIRKKSTDCRKIADRTGKSEQDIKSIKDYLFFNGTWYNPVTRRQEQFIPDAAIGQSWQRLAEGKEILPHDLTLLNHELYEMRLLKEHPEWSQLQAHRTAESRYNYSKESMLYYDDLRKHKTKK